MRFIETSSVFWNNYPSSQWLHLRPRAPVRSIAQEYIAATQRFERGHAWVYSPMRPSHGNGSTILNAAPCGVADATDIRPPCAWTMERQIDNPICAQAASAHVCFGSKADISWPLGHVRCTPESRHRLRFQACPLSAITGLM